MRAIDADVLIEILTTAIRNMQGVAKFIGAEDDPEIKMEIKAYSDILNGVKGIPTIEPERKPGYWIAQDFNAVNGNISTCVYYPPKCSNCGYVGNDNYKYCPDCGSKMDATGKQSSEG